MKEPQIEVGILSNSQIECVLLPTYRINNMEVSGKQIISIEAEKVRWNGHFYEELLFEPTNAATGSFELMAVTIGINFHWQRTENQCFRGALKVIVENGQLTAINVIHIEGYLTSVISSEMSATASLELLKAHAVISRSWLLASINSRNTYRLHHIDRDKHANPDASEHIKWYNREDHLHFDVCADDHCQRYQGITRASTETVRQAIAATRGEVLLFDKEICDARFSKCCGGAFEEFASCWEDINYPYLAGQRDSHTTSQCLPNLCIESEAEKWIRTTPQAFCNTTDKSILCQVLNNYDQETTNFYRWQVSYTQQELSALILQRTGIDFGEILDLVPVQRGTSGRLIKLTIVGSKCTRTIGKELEIRRTLSTSHLYSSAFVIDKEDVSGGIPSKFVLTGAGWGHGVGLCQIGAAVMGEQGYAYDAILLHYYIGATIHKLY